MQLPLLHSWTLWITELGIDTVLLLRLELSRSENVETCTVTTKILGLNNISRGCYGYS